MKGRFYMKFGSFAVLLVCFVIILSACDVKIPVYSTESPSSTPTERRTEAFTDADSEIPSDEATDVPTERSTYSPQDAPSDTKTYTAKVTLLGNTAQISGMGASVSGSTVTVNMSGTFYFKGTFNGRIVVDSSDSEKTKLVFGGINVTCGNGAAIYVANVGDKLVIELEEGTENTLTDGAEYTFVLGDEEEDACIFSRDDLKITGQGVLNINANYEKGIHTKDDFRFEKATLSVTAVGDGIVGKDSVIIASGSVTVTAGDDGLKTKNTDDGKGYINVDGGTVNITSTHDAIQAATDLNVTGGRITLVTGGGSVNSSTSSSAGRPGGWGQWSAGGMGGPGGRGAPGGKESSKTSSDTESAKGLKAQNNITVSGGTLDIDSSDDSICCNGNVIISGASARICSGDDGIHADDTLVISGGTIMINKSYEGLEAATLDLRGGDVSIIATDDGFNAAGGSDSSSISGRPGMGMFSSSSGEIKISGGKYIVNASGDGIDSNGTVEMTGGYVLVYGPTDNGNAALDYDRSCTVTGGTLIALGSTGMAQGVSSGSQPYIFVSLDGKADTQLKVVDASSSALLDIIPPKAYGCILICSEGLVPGGEYTFILGGTTLGSASAK